MPPIILAQNSLWLVKPGNRRQGASSGGRRGHVPIALKTALHSGELQ
jgi:hypothetical protein